MLYDVGIAMLISGIVFIVASLVLMVVWRVPSLIDEISGRKAKRLIQQMKNSNLSIGGNATSSLAVVGVDPTAFSLPTQKIEIPEVPTVSRSVPSGSGSSLMQLVNDPYGTIGGKKRVVQDNISTAEISQPVVKSARVEVLEEQSSVIF